MNRKDFLKTGAGLIGFSAVLPLFPACEKAVDEQVPCPVIPQETEGPYPLDLSDNPFYFRRDITEGKPGTPLTLTLKIINANNNCSPVANARVDVWHCDAEGVYSGFAQPGHNTVGGTFLRGIQLTNKEGEVTFHTIFPGWYMGRITHIHFQVFLNNGLVATSQLAFPEEINKEVYRSGAYAEKGQNTTVTSNASDSIFDDDDLDQQVAAVTANSDTGGYTAKLTVPVAG